MKKQFIYNTFEITELTRVAKTYQYIRNKHFICNLIANAELLASEGIVINSLLKPNLFDFTIFATLLICTYIRYAAKKAMLHTVM